MRKALGTALIALGAMTFATGAMAQDPLYLNCKCTAIYNSSLGTQPSCSTTPDFMAIVDLDRSTIDLKTPNNGFTEGMFGPAAISPGSISARWNIPRANLPTRSLSIDRISGAYSFSWRNDVPAEVRWTGMCTKTAAPQTQF
jgi:hypothetical protein